MAASISLSLYARISAELAEGDTDREGVLARHDLTESAWIVAESEWTSRIAADAFAGDVERLAEAYTRELANAQDAIRPVPRLTVEAWAGLQVEMSRGVADDVLARHQLTQPDYLRLVRHWAREMAKDRAVAKRYAAATVALIGKR